MTAAQLTFSGGHSVNEAYTVFRFCDHHKDNYKDGIFNEEIFQAIPFETLCEKDELTKKACDHAYEALLRTAIKLN
jgi:hypothetical protein